MSLLPVSEIIYRRSVDFLDDLKNSIEQREGAPKYPTGLHDLDSEIFGLHKKELCVIAARPGHGKTSLSLQIAWNIAKRGINCIYLSLEMSGEAIIQRLFCNETRTNGFALRQGLAKEKNIFQEHFDIFRQTLLASPLEIFDRNGRTIKQLEEIIIAMKPQFVFIDHVQRISMQGFANKYDAISDYVNCCGALTIKYNCGIILNSQINRAGANESNAMNFLKGSGELEECADTVLQCRWVSKEEDVRKEKYEVRIVKQRSGPTEEIEINFIPEFYRFENKGGESE